MKKVKLKLTKRLKRTKTVVATRVVVLPEALLYVQPQKLGEMILVLVIAAVNTKSVVGGMHKWRHSAYRIER